jgi:hypothetical protein
MSRSREGGRSAHALLDSHELPTEWAERTVEMNEVIIETRGEAPQCLVFPHSKDFLSPSPLGGEDFQLVFPTGTECRVQPIDPETFDPFVQITISNKRGELVINLSPRMARELGEALTSLPAPQPREAD